MKQTEDDAYKLVDRCNEHINDGTTNSFASYEEGVRDAILWLLEGGIKPCIGRED